MGNRDRGSMGTARIAVFFGLTLLAVSSVGALHARRIAGTLPAVDRAQSGAPAAAASAAPSAVPAEKLAFEVVSIKVNHSGTQQFGLGFTRQDDCDKRHCEKADRICVPGQPEQPTTAGRPDFGRASVDQLRSF